MAAVIFFAQHKGAVHTPASPPCATIHEVAQDHAVQLNVLEDLVLDRASLSVP